LGVAGPEAIQAAIVACWRSFFSANALVARAQRDSRTGDDAMAVLIQPLIEAECAGVCFSVDSIQQRRDLILAQAAWGLGAGVVDGTVPVDTAWVRRSDFSVERRQIVEKTRRMAINRAGELQVEPVPAEQAQAACLPEPWLQRIAQFAVAAEVARLLTSRCGFYRATRSQPYRQN
jgi:pyruvate,water dikinase